VDNGSVEKMRKEIAVVALVIAIAMSSIMESMTSGGDATGNLHDPGDASGQDNGQNDKLRTSISVI
jgi:hypothetical protein